jgi:hypothetical protein
VPGAELPAALGRAAYVENRVQIALLVQDATDASR